jgi:putative membrane protein
MAERENEKVFLSTLLLASGIVFIWSAINPHDYYTWGLEVFPAVIALFILVPTYKRFRLTRMLYLLITIHAVILIVGGHYTYAEVPLGNWARDTFDLTRNHYDRIGHFAQGFIPAMVARELLIRTSPLKPGKWLFALIVLSCLGISAFYELLEWWVAEFSGTAADAFLGTQGDVWDTQKDMALAGLGATIALLTLGRIHDRALKNEVGD